MIPWLASGPYGGVQCANYGTGFDGYTVRGNLNIVNGVAAQGTYSGRLDLPASTTYKSACELLRSRTLGLNSDDWYALDLRFPTDWQEPSDLQAWGLVLAQLNTQYLGCGNPLQLEAHASYVALIVNTGQCSGGSPSISQYYSGNGRYSPRGGMGVQYAIPSSQFSTGAWHQLIIHAHWAPDSSGHLEVWHRLIGNTSWSKTVDLAGYPTLLWETSPATLSSSVAALDKIGAYRGQASFPISVWNDGFCVATSFLAAENCLS